MLPDNKFEIVYSTGENEPADFFYHALCNSFQFDLGLGFFNSSGFRALALGFAYFIVRNGKMRMLINNSLSEEDKAAIERGLISDPQSLIENELIGDLTKLFNVLSRKDKHFFNCLSWLIADKKLEITAIIPTSPLGGIAHHKFGIFKDLDNNKIAFNGSANFSRSALYNNIESIDCYMSWTGSEDSLKRIEHYENLFENCWTGQSKAVKSIQLNKVKTFIRDNFNVTKIDELILDEEELNEQENKSYRNNKLKKEFVRESTDNFIVDKEKLPELPRNISLYDYQITAYEKWVSNGNKGFFEMATGTGKTITALNCALKLYEQNNGLQILILVPTITLAAQWSDEVSNFNFHNIVIANSENPNWPIQIQNYLNRAMRKTTSISMITTYETFVSDKFQSIIKRLNPNSLIIADEAHNFGTFRQIEKYPNEIRNRIGLSATPARHFDVDGTEQLLNFFNSINEPTIKLDLREAIEREFLTNYYYFPIAVYLTDEETEKYLEISLQLFKYFDSANQSFSNTPAVEILLQKRKRIVNQAEYKIDALREALRMLQKEINQIQYTLVYVPEGVSAEDNESSLIDEYARVIVNEFGLKQQQFIGETQERDRILKGFAQGKINVLTAMKCLDEGVDVRRTENAIFCASTSNPRQFIQRRGRILRKHKDKKYARIYDMVVVPQLNSSGLEQSLWMEKSIFSAELKRVHEFATLALNKYQALKSLENIAEQFEIDIYSIKE